MNLEHAVFDVWLSTVFPVGSTLPKQLVERFGSAEELFRRGKTELDFGNDSSTIKLAFEVQDLSWAKSIITRCEKEQVGILLYPSYPQLLKEIPDPPTVFYYKGTIERLERILITVVGTRNPDSDGRRIARLYSEGLTRANLQIVSGFAQGIEAEIHKNIKSTIAVLPNGINVTYPANHWRLKKEILEHDGLLITEFGFDMRALPQNFRFRNRILAGLSPASLIIQSPARSGTAHTFGSAGDYGRDCYVVPGSIFNPKYEGSLNMLKDGGMVTTCPEDIISQYQFQYPDQIQWDAPKCEPAPKQFETSGNDLFDENERKILEALSGRVMQIDEIAVKTDLAVNTVAAVLTNLEIMGYVEKLMGNRYQIK